MTERLEFYDPLYETIIFERGIPSGRGFQLAPAEGPLDPRDVVRSAEFTRLAFLKQVGLAWLIFPSATHTRFAHSIGCWWLGRIAESLIKIWVEMERSDDTSKPRARVGIGPQGDDGVWEQHTLRWWLERLGLREEFYLGLLLHDVGHGPLSHVLEHNPDFTKALQAAGLRDTTHEARGAALLTGEGELAAYWAAAAHEKYRDGTQTLSHISDQLASFGAHVCVPAICYFMTGDVQFHERCSHNHRTALSVLKELISGVLDLDRLDHYARDSYFSGLRQVALNVQGFLANVRIRFPQAESADERWHVSLTGEKAYFTVTDDGASHAASLLFSKRQIVTTMFRNPRSVALHAMANRALSLSIRALPDGDRPLHALQVAMMQDSEFLQSLSSSQSDESRYISKRLAGVQPYACVGKWPNASVSANRSRLRRDVEKVAERNGLVLYADRGFWQRRPNEVAREWLDTSAIMLDDTGRPLTEHSDHRNDFAHLKESGNVSYLWAFSPENGGAREKTRELDDVFRSR